MFHLDPDTKKKVKQSIMELNDSMTRVDAEKEFQKEVIEKLSDETNLPKKLIRKMAKTYHGNAISSIIEEHEQFEHAYNELVQKTI